MTPADLKTARLALGLTQQGLANALDISRVMVGLMERGSKSIERRTELAVKFLLEQKQNEK